MARGIARRDRHDRHPDALGAVVEAEAAGEEPVAEGDLQEVAAARAGRSHHARHDLTPGLEVARRVPDDGGLALGAGGGVQACDLAELHGEEADRVVVAQIGLPDERQARQVVEPPNLDAAEPLTVEGDRKSTRLNSSHVSSSYAVFCLKKNTRV